MSTSFKINVVFGDNKNMLFDNINHGCEYNNSKDGISIKIGKEFPQAVTVTPKNPKEIWKSLFP